MPDVLVIPEQPLTLDQLTALRTEVTARQEGNAKAMGERGDEVERRVFERALRPGSDARFDEIHRAEARRHREACAADDLVACSALGQMYDEGRGTWADEPLAFAFFLQACKVGVYEACRDFGYSSRVERGRWQGSMPHLGFLDGACDEGIAEACTQLGWTYKSGDDGLTEQKARADGYFRRACALGSERDCAQVETPEEKLARLRDGCARDEAKACAGLGNMLRRGQGVARDIAASEALLVQGCDLGSGWACWILGGHETRDGPERLALLDRACGLGQALACHDGANLVMSGAAGEADFDRAQAFRVRGCEIDKDFRCSPDPRAEIARAAAEADPLDPARDAAFPEILQGEARLAREGCMGGETEACLALGDLYLRSREPEHRFLAGALFVPICEAGDPRGCVGLGKVLQYDDEAQELFRNACEVGHLPGCLELARHPKLPAEERYALVKDACTAGLAAACAVQGQALLLGRRSSLSVGADPAQGLALVRLACDLGDAGGCVTLGRELDPSLSNDAVPEEEKDAQQARALYAASCDDRNSDGCSILGSHYETGETVAKDLVKARDLYARECAFGSVSNGCSALTKVELLIERERLRAEYGPLGSLLVERYDDFIPDWWARVRRARALCREGEMVGCIRLGAFYYSEYSGGSAHGLVADSVDRTWGRVLYRHACEEGAAEGCHRYAQSFVGIGEESEPAVALEWSRRGCDLGHAWSCNEVGYQLSNGFALPQDFDAAEAAYRRACALGLDYSCKQLWGSHMWDANPETALERKLIACLHGDDWGCRDLAETYEDGAGWLSAKKQVAAELKRMAYCADGNAEACEVD
ncbi:MAG: tetratricopeptide repeat protein [Pseudomonadota bacterium]